MNDLLGDNLACWKTQALQDLNYCWWLRLE